MSFIRQIPVLAVCLSVYGFAVSHFFVVVPAAWLCGWRSAVWCALAGVVISTGIILAIGESNYLVTLTLQGATFYTLAGVMIGWMCGTVRELRQAKAEIRSLRGLLRIWAE